MFSSGVTSFSGGGRKSGTLDSLPTGLFGSVEFFCIILLSFSPIAGADYPDLSAAIGKPDRQYPVFHFSYAEKPLFFCAVPGVGVDLSFCVLKRL